jgi:hypothetical protein
MPLHSFLSYLSRSGQTETPGEVVRLASIVADVTRNELRGLSIQARLWPDQGQWPLVIAEDAVPSSRGPAFVARSQLRGRDQINLLLSDEHGASFALNFSITGKSASIIATIQRSMALCFPDAPEILHFIGILLDALAARLVDVGCRDSECNESLLRRPSITREVSGPMAVCSDVPGVLRQQIDQIFRQESDVLRGKNFFVSSDLTDTPVLLFAWVCDIVVALRTRFKKRPKEASLWCYRENLVAERQSVGPAGDATNVIYRDGWLTLVIPEGAGNCCVITFSQGPLSRLGVFAIRVPTLLHALHAAGMVLNALDISDVDLGRRDMESNDDVLARPLPPGAQHGQMVSAGNFVAPLSPVLVDQDE